MALAHTLEACIRYHHDIAQATEHDKAVALVHIANVLAMMAEVDDLDLADVSPIGVGGQEITGLDAASVASAAHEAQAEIKEVEQLFPE